MIPLLEQCRQRKDLVELCFVATGQHREMTRELFDLFSIQPDEDFDLMQVGQTLESLTSRILERTAALFKEQAFDAVCVHGDTTTAFAVSLAAFYAQIPVAHVEAGLRTHDLNAPFPEEMNRRFVDLVARWYFAPTERNAANLRAEAVKSHQVDVVGNTVIDAVHLVSQRLEQKAWCPQWSNTLPQATFDALQEGRFILATCHRRENHAHLPAICAALKTLADQDPGRSIVLPVHPNPRVKATVEQSLGGIPNILLTEPLDYLSFIWLLQRTQCVLTDSGGVQEEAPALGKMCVIMRESTERPEVLDSGWGMLVGADTDRIVAGVQRAIAEKDQEASSRSQPFGNGTAAQQILDRLLKDLST